MKKNHTSQEKPSLSFSSLACFPDSILGNSQTHFSVYREFYFIVFYEGTAIFSTLQSRTI